MIPNVELAKNSSRKLRSGDSVSSCALKTLHGVRTAKAMGMASAYSTPIRELLMQRQVSKTLGRLCKHKPLLELPD